VLFCAALCTQAPSTEARLAVEPLNIDGESCYHGVQMAKLCALLQRATCSLARPPTRSPAHPPACSPTRPPAARACALCRAQLHSSQGAAGRHRVGRAMQHACMVGRTLPAHAPAAAVGFVPTEMRDAAPRGRLAAACCHIRTSVTAESCAGPVQTLLDRSVANLHSALTRLPPIGSRRGVQLKAAVQIELAMVHEEYAPPPALHHSLVPMTRRSHTPA
jgi:hypothetical protein